MKKAKPPKWLKGIDPSKPYPMSVRLLRAISSDKRLKPTERLILLSMVFRRRWQEPSYVADLVSTLDLPTRAVERALSRFDELGILHRSGAPRKRVFSLAPPEAICPEILSPKSGRNLTANKSELAVKKPSKPKARLTANLSPSTAKNLTASPPENVPRKKRKPKTVQKVLFEGATGTNLTDSDACDDTPEPTTKEELFDEYCYQMREAHDVDVKGKLHGQNSGKWDEKLLDPYDEEDRFEIATKIIRLIVWDWKKARDLWPKALGRQSVPSIKAVWMLADSVEPFIETGMKGSGKGRDRGYESRYFKKFVKGESVSADDDDDPLNWGPKS